MYEFHMKNKREQPAHGGATKPFRGAGMYEFHMKNKGKQPAHGVATKPFRGAGIYELRGAEIYEFFSGIFLVYCA